MASAVIFTMAFATKLYAVFMLVPLALFYFHYRQQNLKRPLVAAAFFVPLVVFVFAWYQFIIRGSVLDLFSHNDFVYLNPSNVVPSPFFVAIFLWVTLGGFLLVATVFSLVVCLGQRRLFKAVLPLELICLAAILAVAGVDTIMGAALNYQAPFTGAVKYNYQLLPFICLLAASLIAKVQTLFGALKKRFNPTMLFSIVAAVGAGLFLAALFEDFQNVGLYSQSDYFVFWTQGFLGGYSFRSSAPLTSSSALTYVQYLGFALVISGLIWAVLNEAPLSMAVKKFRTRF